jgi:hypothetical protein
LGGAHFFERTKEKPPTTNMASWKPSDMRCPKFVCGFREIEEAQHGDAKSAENGKANGDVRRTPKKFYGLFSALLRVLR